MDTLDQIFVRNNTDKGSKHEYCPHNYGPHYESFFNPRRFDPLRMLEIGVGGGQSIQSWLEYFWSPSYKLFGADIVRDTNPWNTPGATPDSRYEFVHLDQESEQNLDCFVAMTHGCFDVIIEDGAHTNTGIIRSFNKLWPTVTPSGLYCVEDLGAGYTPGSVFIKPGVPDHKTWLHSLVDQLMTAHGDIESVHFSPELAIIKKCPKS